MGLLSKGTPLGWEESKKYANHIRDHGMKQLIALYKRVKDRDLDRLKWGDEIEYTLVYMDDANKESRLALIADKVLDELQIPENLDERNIDSCWRMEYANYMIEGTPGKPFCCSLCRLRYVETSMYLRRMEAMKCLQKFPNLKLVNYAAYPRLGCENFTEPKITIDDVDKVNPASRSLFYPDKAIFQAHPRFATLTRNIRSRRGKKQQIYVPIYKDVNTPSPFIDPIPTHLDIDQQAINSRKEDQIYMDCMGFGMGCSCLQLTLQACNINEARFLYDQLVPLAPLFMSLSAASPIWKGYMSDYDCRWIVISGSVDDRTPQEYSIMEDGKPQIPKSRFDSVDMYISPENSAFNDIRVECNEKYIEQLMNAGIDEQLATHFAHLFIRDPISVFKEKLDIDDEVETDHFENIQSTNWQSVRFKPPPPNTPIGWRVEFRSLEVQITDFGNAAFVVFVMLLTRLMTAHNLDLVMPISLIDENMKRAHFRDAVKTQKFHIRKDITSRNGKYGTETTELDLNTIINGNDEFVGLVPLLKDYLDNIQLHIETRWHVNQSIDIISGIASGKYLTIASWMRHFVSKHPNYKNDSVVPADIIYDLTNEMIKISEGEIGCTMLMGSHIQNPISTLYINNYRAMLRCDTHMNTNANLNTQTDNNDNNNDNNNDLKDPENPDYDVVNPSDATVTINN